MLRCSLKELFVAVTLVCVAIGVLVATFGGQPDEVLTCFLATVLAVECVAALYAIVETRNPKPLESAKPPTAWIWVRGSVLGLLFTGLGGIGILAFIDNNLTMDTGGASPEEWKAGIPLIVATCVGCFARGATLSAFMSLQLDTGILGRGWATVFGLCAGSFLGLVLWRTTGDPRSLSAGIVCVISLIGAVVLAVTLVKRGMVFAQRSRRWGAFGFLGGVLIGPILAFIPPVTWLLFWQPPVSMFLTATIASSLGAIAGMLMGAEKWTEN